MERADEITRAGLDPDQCRSELSALMDSANANVLLRRKQQERDGTLEASFKIPVFSLLPSHKDRGTNADFSNPDNIRVSEHCTVTRERLVDSLKTNLRELFPGEDMFYGQSPNNSDEICEGTDIMKHWKERGSGLAKRVRRGWRYPIEFNQCRQSFIVPTISPIRSKYMDVPCLITSPDKLTGEERAPEIDPQITSNLKTSIVGVEEHVDHTSPAQSNDRDSVGRSESDVSLAEGQRRRKRR